MNNPDRSNTPLRDRSMCPEFPLECPAGLPKRFFDALERYAVQRIPTGGFLRAVLENNLRLAVAVADEESVNDLKKLVSFIHNYLPGNSWGDSTRVQEWLGGY